MLMPDTKTAKKKLDSSFLDNLKVKHDAMVLRDSRGILKLG